MHLNSCRLEAHKSILLTAVTYTQAHTHTRTQTFTSNMQIIFNAI